MITLAEFISYSLVEQHQYICDRGVCLQGKQEGEFEVYLYGVESFFVELRYHTLSQRFARVKAFKEGPCLEEYLAGITLPAIL